MGVTEDVHPAAASKGDLFRLGCVAKVSGVQGRRQGELSLVVEGMERCRVERFVRERPYFEAQLVGIEDLGEFILVLWWWCRREGGTLKLKVHRY